MSFNSHRSSASLSSSNSQNALYVQSNSSPKRRRMTTPALPPPASLGLPEMRQSPGRPPSPLRNGFVPRTNTGIDPDDVSDDEEEEEDRSWGRESPAPSATSVTQFAANFANRVGSLVGNIASSRPSGMPTDAELEAEAQLERDRSRKEAERILSLETDQRRTVEERVMEMMNSHILQSSAPLPPPRSRSQTLSNPPSPSSSQKESSGGWWSAAKNRLSSKDKDLTPAQQVIQETKAREKDKKKGKDKEPAAEKSWPSSPDNKYNDPAFLNLSTPTASTATRKPLPASPSSPTPSRPFTSNQPPNLSPSPMRSLTATPSSPSREPPPLYAQFNNQGTLDVPGTLLTIARRFEKLEKWTVGHVRALEERMGDVERWLVDKEKDKDKEKERSGFKESKEGENGSSEQVERNFAEIRDEVAELQGRVGELGREMAKLATAPSNLSSGPARQSSGVSTAPQTNSSIAVHETPSPSPRAARNTVSSPTLVPLTPHTRLPSSTARESTSPPITSSRGSGRARLPYPTGDYTIPSDMFSPPNSPPSSMTSATRSHNEPSSVSGLPPVNMAQTNSTGLPSTGSPVTSYSPAASPGNGGLPAPRGSGGRPASVSPTPRKRYTVALGGPLVAPHDPDQESDTETHYKSIESAILASSPASNGTDDEDESEAAESEDGLSGLNEDTIGRSSGVRLVGNGGTNAKTTSKPDPSRSNLRSSRAQSAYGFSSIVASSSQTNLLSGSTSAPVIPRLRSRSTDRFGLGIIGLDGGDKTPVTPTSGKFVDPLVLRRQEKEGTKIAMPVPAKGKIPIGQLVAFFDEKKPRGKE